MASPGRRPTGVAAALAAVAVLVGGSGPDEPERTGASVPVEAERSADAAEQEAEKAEAIVDTVRETLLANYGVDSTRELRQDVEGSKWAASLDRLHLQDGTLYVTLNINRRSPDRQEVGERAANAVAVAARGVDGVDRVVSEDFSGRDIAEVRPQDAGR